MKNKIIHFGAFLIFLAAFQGCFGIQQLVVIPKYCIPIENIVFIEKIIYRAEKNLEAGNLRNARKLCDEAIHKLFAIKMYLEENEYERLHNELAMLRLKINHSIDSDAKVIESDLFPLVWNSRVDKWINFYVTRGRDNFLRWLERSTKFLPHIKKVLKRYNLPLDLAYVPIIESGFNPFARSRVGAVGMWQFMKPTGKSKGLEVTHWIDERRNPYKSTIAAVEYLKCLYYEFECWKLALAAYNMGRSALRRRINKWNIDDYWNLPMPRETANFVPKIMAAIFIAREPTIFGFEPVCMTKPAWKEFEVIGAIDLGKVAEWSGVNVREIHMLNSELRQMSTPPGVKYKLRIPYDSFDKFVSKYNSLEHAEKYLSDKEIAKRATRAVFHRVRRGDNLWIIAQKFNVGVSQIKRWNNLRTSRIYPRQKLKIYRRGI